MMAGLALASAPAAAQPKEPLAPQLRAALEKVALGKARTALLRQVGALPLKGDVTVATWAAADLSRDRQLHRWVRSLPRHGNIRVYSDGVAEADLRLASDELARQLSSLCDATKSATDSINLADIAAAARNWPTLWSSADAAATAIRDDAAPDGWEDVTPEGAQLARLAASADAVFALVDESAKLKVTAARRLHEFLDASTEVRDAATDAVRQAARISVDLAPDQTAVADAVLPMSELIRILGEVHQKHYTGDLFQAPDFREMALSSNVGELRAQGLAPPPDAHRLRPTDEPIDLDTPAWANQTLTATARHEPRPRESASLETRIELARLDGVDRLRRQVEKLVIQKDITVEAFLAIHPSLKDDVILFLSGARDVEKPSTRPDGMVELRVELPLRRLWHILRRAMDVIEVAPTATAPATLPASQPASRASTQKGSPNP